ncbi:hypothetical protein E4U42_003118 [Claviceps africana]|uniref:DUF7492 domain-containing protein n=1 Tax=Claviceps africana TaxID=83212 RepID=A0A8K0NLT9_9HYPO|nr:hypothetical protein E4U42_003118 [Claviceps africana]
MRKTSYRVGLCRLVSTLALASSVTAHSWIEYALRIAPNGTMVGERGFPRGYMARDQPGFSDQVPQHILPAAGQAAYTGQEVLNKFPFEANPKHPLLQAAPGDHVAIIHLENGHVSLPQNQPKKPLNRGTIFFYGTSQPKEQERLFDVHLRWNKDGTGGDKRGIFLGTKDYDDGQCFQPNTAAITNERASRFSSDGAKISQELPCQSDIKLPDNLKPGSVYTVYWYWDWPDLNADKINVQKTKDGSYPWAGSFMRGDPVPNGWTMNMISKNESYASVIDIKIIDAPPKGFSAMADVKQKWVAQQNIYSKAIEAQMNSNFQVAVGNIGGGGGGSSEGGASASSGSMSRSPAPTDASGSGSGSGSAPGPLTSACNNPSPPPPPPPPGSTSAAGGGVVTVTQTVMVPPTTILNTVYRTVAPGEKPVESGGGDVTVTVTSHVQRPNPPEPTRESGSQAPPARRHVRNKYGKRSIRFDA